MVAVISTPRARIKARVVFNVRSTRAPTPSALAIQGASPVSKALNRLDYRSARYDIHSQFLTRLNGIDAIPVDLWG